MARLAKVFPSDAVKDSMSEKPYKLMQDNVVSCCGWCYPGQQIAAAFPEVSGMKISHGICPTHKVEFMKELQSIEHLSVRPCSSR